MQNNIPNWDLSSLYTSINDENIEKDINNVTKLTTDFTAYSGLLNGMQSDGIYDIILKYEEIEKLLSKLYTFAYLTYVTNVTIDENKVFLQKIKDLYTNIASQLVFFTIEISDISDDKINSLLAKNSKLNKYAPYIRDVRKFKNHILSKEAEEIIINKDSTGMSSIIKLFDEYSARLRFSIDEKSVNISEAIDKLSSKDQEKRKAAAQEIGKVFAQNSWFYTIIMNTIAKDKANNDSLRKYKNSISQRNISNFIEDETVECLINSVKNKYSKISHKYYKIKTKLLGLEILNYYDRNAPIPVDDDRTYTFEEAKDIVLRAYNAFCPKIGAIVQMFFDKNWIDAKTGEFKMSGAFCCNTTSDLHPFVMMNFLGKSRDVTTLAHELGHGVHMYLSRSQGQLMQDTPLTLAETASIFGEQLVFQEMLKNAASNKEKLVLLCQKADDMINTVIRQIAFCEFETLVHKQRKEKELTSDEICNIWLKVQSDSLGESVNLDGDYKYYWTYISHFIHSPFYVYAYAFGDLLVNSLYKSYQNGNVSDFQDKYYEMLSSGGTLHHSELLKPFNLNANDQNFWNMGLDVMENIVIQIDELSHILANG